MKTYMSLCTQSAVSVFVDMWKLSLALAKKHYGEVTLITDNLGQQILSDLPFDNVITRLDSMLDYPTIWSLGKIYAYKHGCEQNEPFLHLDADVFLWEPLPENLLNSGIFCQSGDFHIGEGVYDVDKLHSTTGCDVPSDWQTFRNTKTYNQGIFGGTDIQLINSYCDYVLNMIEDPKHHPLWSHPRGCQSKACLIEQGNLGIFCNKNSIVPEVYYSELVDGDLITYKKYSHLMAGKNNSQVRQNISNRVRSMPYNLQVADATEEEWANYNNTTERNE